MQLCSVHCLWSQGFLVKSRHLLCLLWNLNILVGPFGGLGKGVSSCVTVLGADTVELCTVSLLSPSLSSFSYGEITIIWFPWVFQRKRESNEIINIPNLYVPIWCLRIKKWKLTLVFSIIPRPQIFPPSNHIIQVRARGPPSRDV